MKPIYFLLFLSLFMSCKISTDYGKPIIPVLKNLKDWKAYQEYVRWGTFSPVFVCIFIYLLFVVNSRKEEVVQEVDS